MDDKGVFISQVPIQVPFFFLLNSIRTNTKPVIDFGQTNKARAEPSTQHPSLAITVCFVETADMVDDTEPTQFGPHVFHRPRSDSILLSDRFQDRQKLSWRPLNLHNDCQEHPLMRLVPWKQDFGQIIQSFQPANLTVVQIYFRT